MKKKELDMILIISLVVVGIILLWFVGTYNMFIKQKTSLDEAFSTMDVYLKKRWDLIPNLVETVKGYAEHEKGTFEKVVELRNTAYSGLPSDEKIALNAELSTGLAKLLAVAENYPDLKANQNFMDLSAQLSQIEADIANSRKYYNAIVKDYNIAVQTIPSNIIAAICQFKPAKMFEIDETQRENVQVKF